MSSRSPILEGFRTILRRPSFGLAEISWRWSFGAAAAMLLTFSLFEYLDTLPVTRLDYLLLKTRHPTLVGQAMAHIFRGSSARMVRASIVLAVGLAVAWILLAALARAATIKALVARFREASQDDRARKSWGMRSLLGLNFFRVAAALAAALGGVGALLLGGIASSPGQPAPGATGLLVLASLFLVWLAWLVVNWFLSLASVFAVAAQRDTFGSIAAAVQLCRDQAGAVFAAGTWFGLAHIVAFFMATSIVAFPLGFAGFFPPAVVLGGVLLVTLFYFAVVDFLYMGRLAAYVAMVELPLDPVALQGAAPLISSGGQPSVIGPRPSSSVDQDEVILSDLPAQT
jgi:hypothetical protein